MPDVINAILEYCVQEVRQQVFQLVLQLAGCT